MATAGEDSPDACERKQEEKQIGQVCSGLRKTGCTRRTHGSMGTGLVVSFEEHTVSKAEWSLNFKSSSDDCFRSKLKLHTTEEIGPKLGLSIIVCVSWCDFVDRIYVP
jgi:hypothetical protein